MPIDPKLAQTYWEAAAPGAPMPELTGDDLVDFLALVDGGQHEKAFSRLPLTFEDPYPAIAVVPEPERALEEWAIGVAELVPIGSLALEHYVLYVDTIADAEGAHRVYPFSEGYPAQDIATLDDALRFMAAIVRYAKGEAGKEVVEEAEAALVPPEPWRWSGAEVFGHLSDLPLHVAFQAWSLKTWPQIEVFAIDDIAPDEAGAARIGMISAIMQVLETQRLAVRRPPEDTNPAHLALFSHLEALVQAVSLERAPQVVVDTVESDDPELARLAKEWLARFEKATTEEPASPKSDTQTAFMRAVTDTVQRLVAAEAIEVADEARHALVEELTLAALDANDPRHALKRMCKALLASDNVEEVYVSDSEIEGAFRAAFS